MYLEHYGLTEPPFRITPHTDFFFSGANRGATLDALVYAVTHEEGIVKISGEVGSGKTMLCRVLMERLPEHVVTLYLANPSLSREDILLALADELGIHIPGRCKTARIMRLLQEKLVALYATGKQVVALIDEAHAMPIETLEEIRLLSNLESSRHKLLKLVLFGQPELNEILARSNMRQLRERITQSFYLAPLTQQDISRYLEFRMQAAGYRGPTLFAPAIVNIIARASQGLTRRVNILADKALLAAYANGCHQIGDREITAALRDVEFSGQNNRLPAWWRDWKWGLSGMLALMAGLLIWHAAPSSPPSIPETAQHAGSSPSTLFDSLFQNDHAWLDRTPDHHWLVQLWTPLDDSPVARIEDYLESARNAGLELARLHVYRLDVAGVDRHGVVYGDFVTREAAVRFIESLPDEFKRYRPYPRQANRLKMDRIGRKD